MGKYAIFLVLALTFSMLTYSYALRNSIFISNHRNVQSYSHSQAHNIAQGIAMLSIKGIQTGDGKFMPAENEYITIPSGSDEFQYWEEMQGYYRITIERKETDMSDGVFPVDEYIVYSTGKYEETEYTITAGIIRTYKWDPNVDNAILSEETLDLGGDIDIIGDVTLNSNNASLLTLYGNAKIEQGNVFLGPSANTDLVSHKDIIRDGGLFNLPKKINEKPPQFPAFPSGYMTGGSVYGSQTLTPAEYEGYFIPEIDLESNSTLTIDTQGNDIVLYTGKFNVQSSDVEIVGGGKVTMYVETHFDLRGRAKVNEGGDPGQLQLFYKGDQEVDLYDDTLTFSGNTYFNGSLFAEKANIRLTGTTGVQGHVKTGGPVVEITGNADGISRLVSAPNATIRLTGNPTVRGSIHAKQFVGTGNATIIHDTDFDAALMDLWMTEPKTSVAWWN